MDFATIRRVRAEILEPEAGWSNEARAVMRESREMVRIEDRLLRNLTNGSVIATYSMRFEERLKEIEARLTSLENEDKDPS